MLQAYVIEWSLRSIFYLAKFAYNNNYHLSIEMTLFKALCDEKIDLCLVGLINLRLDHKKQICLESSRTKTSWFNIDFSQLRVDFFFNPKEPKA